MALLILCALCGCAACLTLSAFCGCSGRERTNPFDPLNHDTHGEPHAARAVAGCGIVALTWNDLGMDDLRGFNVWRAPIDDLESESLLTQTSLPAAAADYADTSVVNGIVYRYRIEYIFEGGSRSYAAPVEARPGAALAWCADACGWGLPLLGPDAGSVQQTLTTGGIVFDLDVDQLGHRVFVAEIDSGLVVILRSTGERISALPVDGASCVSWSASADAIAVGAFYDGYVSWITTSGQPLFDLPLSGSHPEDVAFRDETVTWIGLYEGPLLRVDIASGTIDTLDIDLGRPVALCDDPGRGCWVADRSGAVAYVSDDGTSVIDLVDFEEPLDLDADGRGGCWVADYGRRALVHIDRETNLIEERTGMGAVAGVTCDPVSDALWLALPERGEVRYLRLADGWLHGVDVGGCPRKVAGDWSGGCEF